MTDRAEEIRRMIDRGLPKASDFKSNMPGAIDYPDFFYTPEGKFIDPMGSSRIMGGTPGRAEEGFGRGKGRKGAEIATLDYSTLSIKDLIDRYGISREQAEKIVEFNTKQMIERSAGNRARPQDTSDNNLLEKILPFLGFSTRTPSSGIMEIMKNQPPVSPGANEDLIFELMKEKGKETGRGKLAYGGRIGFESGTEGTVGSDVTSRKRANYFDLKRDEFMSLADYLKSGMSEKDLEMKANGGRIGFDNGGFSLGPAEEMQMLMKRLMDEGGMSEKDAAQEAEKMLFGPSAMKLRDSKKGIGSMMAAADDDEYKSPPFLDDPEGRMSTDELEAIMQIMQEGRLSELEDSDQFMIYDLLLEKDMLPDGIDSFEDFKRMYSGQDSMMASRREGIMQMVG